MKTLILLLGAFALAPSLAVAAPPVIDGNLEDLIQYARDLQVTDTGNGALLADKIDAVGNPLPETIYSDGKFIPCPMVGGLPPPLLSHWANGTEIFFHYVAYEFGSTTLYVGLRTEGAIGDVDGDDDPDFAGSGAQCNPQDNIEDGPGISGNQQYIFRFDFNCDGVPDAILRAEENQIVGSGLFSGTTTTFAYKKNAAVGASGHDLEMAVHLAAPLPDNFNYVGVQANAFDGLTEDSAPGANFVGSPRLSLAPPPDVRVCPGDKGRLTIAVTNAGRTPLSVNVLDTLPAGFAYAGNLATDCGTGEPAVAGSVLTFPTFQMTGGAACTIAFDVASDANCAGEGRNLVDVDGTFTSSCFIEGGGQTVTAEVTSSLTCDPALCAPEGTCRLSGGGCMNDDPDTGKRGHKQNSFGGNSSPLNDGGGPSGNSWEHILRDGRETLFNWHSWDAHVIGCSVVGVGPCHPSATNTRADFVGTGKYSIGSGGREEAGNMVAYIVDHKEGSCNKGTRDEYFITVRKGLVIGQGDIVFDRGGFIDCGNLQIHETPARLFGNGISLPGNSPGAALLGRAYPNPFAGTTNFAYRAADGGQTAFVGVYNVAGRLVKTLASGSQNAGTYTVTWDGTDDAGVRMAPGVYFLKSRVGNDQTVNRLIYVAR